MPRFSALPPPSHVLELWRADHGATAIEPTKQMDPILYKTPSLRHLRVVGSPRLNGSTFASETKERCLSVSS